MTAFLALLFLAAPFLLLGALIAVLTVTIGNETKPK